MVSSSCHFHLCFCLFLSPDLIQSSLQFVRSFAHSYSSKLVEKFLYFTCLLSTALIVSLSFESQLCIGDVFCAALETAFSSCFLLIQSQVASVKLQLHTCNGQIAQDLHVCAGFICNQQFSGTLLIFEVSSKLLIVSIYSSVKAELFSHLWGFTFYLFF